MSFEGSNTSRETFIQEVAKALIGVGFRHNPCRRASRLRLPGNVASNSRYLPEICAPVRVAFFHSIRSQAGLEGIPRKTSISTISSRSPVTALNPATHPPDTCFQIVCGTRQSIVEGFINLRGDLSCVGLKTNRMVSLRQGPKTACWFSEAPCHTRVTLGERSKSGWRESGTGALAPSRSRLETR